MFMSLKIELQNTKGKKQRPKKKCKSKITIIIRDFNTSFSIYRSNRQISVRKRISTTLSKRGSK